MVSKLSWGNYASIFHIFLNTYKCFMVFKCVIIQGLKDSELQNLNSEMEKKKKSAPVAWLKI
ncbi:hypothetical protein D8M04_07590 [Oceanobacillus piezotolerans]|uniref:Uncharacterized protein n=1 Tax=Oceanobacillus piezotolerans TaxID=2448030 RepID=A0A498D9F2_9BACI|nr:hypothetical protein D8M04_07590 [Oceanobacillus piezotolerans]